MTVPLRPSYLRPAHRIGPGFFDRAAGTAQLSPLPYYGGAGSPQPLPASAADMRSPFDQLGTAPPQSPPPASIGRAPGMPGILGQDPAASMLDTGTRMIDQSGHNSIPLPQPVQPSIRSRIAAAIEGAADANTLNPDSGNVLETGLASALRAFAGVQQLRRGVAHQQDEEQTKRTQEAATAAELQARARYYNAEADHPWHQTEQDRSDLEAQRERDREALAAITIQGRLRAAASPNKANVAELRAATAQLNERDRALAAARRIATPYQDPDLSVIKRGATPAEATAFTAESTEAVNRPADLQSGRDSVSRVVDSLNARLQGRPTAPPAGATAAGQQAILDLLDPVAALQNRLRVAAQPPTGNGTDRGAANTRINQTARARLPNEVGPGDVTIDDSGVRVGNGATPPAAGPVKQPNEDWIAYGARLKAAGVDRATARNLFQQQGWKPEGVIVGAKPKAKSPVASQPTGAP